MKFDSYYFLFEYKNLKQRDFVVTKKKIRADTIATTLPNLQFIEPISSKYIFSSLVIPAVLTGIQLTDIMTPIKKEDRERINFSFVLSLLISTTPLLYNIIYIKKNTIRLEMCQNEKSFICSAALCLINFNERSIFAMILNMIYLKRVKL